MKICSNAITPDVGDIVLLQNNELVEVTQVFESCGGTYVEFDNCIIINYHKDGYIYYGTHTYLCDLIIKAGFNIRSIIKP